MGINMRHLQDTIGSGNWAIFPSELIQKFEERAPVWRTLLADVKKPWLCWSVDPQWCTLQQQLVVACGWTPIVCADSPDRKIELNKNAIYIDFREGFEFEGVLLMHFCIESCFCMQIYWRFGTAIYSRH